MIKNSFLVLSLTTTFAIFPSGNVGDSLWHIEAKIGQLLDGNAFEIQDFTSTTTALTQVLLEAYTLESKIDLLSTQLLATVSTTTTNLSTVTQLELNVIQNFNSTFTLLESIFLLSCTIDSEIDILAEEITITPTQIPPLLEKLCTIESSLDLLGGIGEGAFNDVAGTVTLLSTLQEITCNIEQQVINLTACSSMPFSGSPSLIINNRGSYCLTGPLIGTIIIAIDGVDLDLNGYTITAPAGQPGILVDNIASIPNSLQIVITIKNGSIDGQGSASHGILITNSANIDIAQVSIFNCTKGIEVNTRSIGCVIGNCAIFNPDIGILFLDSDSCVAQDTSIISARSMGFFSNFFNQSGGNFINRCIVNQISSGNNSIGISLNNGQANLCQECIINDILSTSTNPNASVAGILINGENNTSVLNCTLSNIRVAGGSAIPYGIITTSSTLYSQVNGNFVCGVTGGAGGIGYERLLTSTTSLKSLFTSNIGYSNDINFGSEFDVTEFFEGGLNGIAGAIENISLPPF